MADHITHDPAYRTVERDDFPAMIETHRYAERCDAFDEIISLTVDHFWDPGDPAYVDFEVNECSTTSTLGINYFSGWDYEYDTHTASLVNWGGGEVKLRFQLSGDLYFPGGSWWIDDVVITQFSAGPGATTLPVYVFGLIRRGVTPLINATSVIMLAASIVLVLLSLLAQRSGGTPFAGRGHVETDRHEHSPISPKETS